MFDITARPRLVCLLAFLVMAATAVATSADNHPFFETVVPAPSTEEAWINAYPVLDQLPSGRLVCIYATQNHGASAKMKIAVVTSDDDGRTWSAPQVIFDHPGLPDGDPNLIVDGDHILAFVTTLVYPGKINETNVYMRKSPDGVHWSEDSKIKLPHRYVCGKIHHGYKLSDGTLIMGYSWDIWAEQNMPPRTEGEMILKSSVLRSNDGGTTWSPGADMSIDLAKTSPDATWGVAEPATVVLADGRVMTLMRTGGTKMAQAWSSDGGLTWSKPVESALTAHNDPAALDKLSKTGEIVAAWDESPTNRYPLTAALSGDGGVHWSPSKIIADSPGYQASYPSVKQTNAGTILVAWQQALASGGREIHLARFSRAWLVSK